jgi:hypothetical protein
MVKKTLVIFAIAVAAIGLVAGSFFAGAVLVKAQAGTPESQTPREGGFGHRMMDGGHPMAQYMHAALAVKLGMAVEELESQLVEGKTIWQIAEAKGLSEDETNALMQDAHKTALDQMVAEGKITQAQADLIAQHGTRMMGRRGGCPMGDNDEGASNGGRGGMMGGRGMMGLWNK